MFERILKIWSEEIIFFNSEAAPWGLVLFVEQDRSYFIQRSLWKVQKMSKKSPLKSSKWLKTIDPKLTQLSSICFNLVAHYQLDIWIPRSSARRSELKKCWFLLMHMLYVEVPLILLSVQSNFEERNKNLLLMCKVFDIRYQRLGGWPCHCCTSSHTR